MTRFGMTRVNPAEKQHEKNIYIEYRASRYVLKKCRSIYTLRARCHSKKSKQQKKFGQTRYKKMIS